MKLRLTDIRHLLLAQSVEESDPREAILPESERDSASAAAGAPLDENAGVDEKNQFMVQRAERLISFLEPRETAISETVKNPPLGKFRLFALGGAVVALVVGFLTNELGPDKKINILAFPLLGILVWNLVIYFREIIGFFRKKSGDFSAHFLDRFLPKRAGSENSSVEIQQAVSLFRKNWTRALIPVFSARVKAFFHLAAALLAIGAIAGMYVKGLANEYRAIFESTFFENAESFRPVLEVVLGPASALSRIGLPDLALLDTAEGMSAAPWIHLYAVTMAIFVILPRLVLSGIWRSRSAAREKSVPFQDFAPAYFERLLAVSTGDALKIAVIPYAHDPSSESRKRIQKQAEDLIGGAANLTWLDSIPFGAEEDTIVIAESAADLIVLFNFASTPEVETHGAVLKTLMKNTGGTRFHVFLDAESFDRKADSFPDAEERKQTRFEGWKTVLGQGLESDPLIISQNP